MRSFRSSGFATRSLRSYRLRSRAETPPISFGHAVEELVLALIELLGADHTFVELPDQLHQLSTDRRRAVVVSGRGFHHLIDCPQSKARRAQRQQQQL